MSGHAFFRLIVQDLFVRGSKAELSGEAAAVELIPANYCERLDLAQVFGRTAALEVDVGCGDGTLLAALAEQEPGRNFLGIERMLGRVRGACRKAAARGLANVRVLRIENSYAVRYLLPVGSVHVFHVLFPDPWPKTRHHGRRLLDAEFLGSLHAALADTGLLRIVTDQEDYFRATELAANETRLFVPNPPGEYPMTTFEKRFCQQSLPIYRLELRKRS